MTVCCSFASRKSPIAYCTGGSSSLPIAVMAGPDLAGGRPGAQPNYGAVADLEMKDGGRN